MGVLLNRRRYMGASKQAKTLFEMYNQYFDGTVNSVVDTGLKLWNGTHNRWKMEAVYQKLSGQTTLTTLFTVRPDSSPYSGIRYRYGGSGNDFELTISDSWNIIKNDGGFQIYVQATYGNALRKNVPLDYDSLTIIRDGNTFFIDYNGYTVDVLITNPLTNNLNLLIGCDYKGANNETQRYYTGTVQKFVIKELPPADEVIMTSITNPEVLAVCYAQGWCADANYMTKSEAEAVTNISTVFKDNTQITHFEELQYFGITALSNSAFYGCSNLRQVTLKENLSFGGRVFQNTGLTSIVIPYGVTFANNDFSGCTSLVSIQLYDGLVNMPDLSGCTSLTRVDVPSSVRGYTNVRNDTSLVYINCPEGVTSIPAQCFRDCSSLPSVELPSTITSIGESAFRGMRSLSSFIIHAVTPPTLGANNTFNTTCMFYVPAESVEAYKTASGWSSFASRIQAIDETIYIQDGLIFQLDGIAKGNSADTSTWVDLKGGLVFTQEGVVESLANGWHFDGTCYLTCSTLLSGSSDYTVEVCMSNFILWHNGTWGDGNPYFYNIDKNLYFLQRNVPVRDDNIPTVIRSPFTASLNLDTCYINKILYTGRGGSNFFSDPKRFDIGYYRSAYSTGTIYAIRIYNRRLTSEEQLHNQDVDIARFNISI